LVLNCYKRNYLSRFSNSKTVFSEENFTDAIVVEASRFKKIARKKKFLEIQKYVQRTIAHLYQVITHKIL